VLLLACRWTTLFLEARYVPSTESLIHRLLYWLYTIFYMLFGGWGVFDPFIKSIFLQTGDSITRYALARDHDKYRLFLTQRGYIGLCPSTARPGDKVYILLGSRVPHVLRNCDNHEAGYTLIGDAFVYGAMDGELMVSASDQVNVEIF